MSPGVPGQEFLLGSGFQHFPPSTLDDNSVLGRILAFGEAPWHFLCYFISFFKKDVGLQNDLTSDSSKVWEIL